MTDDELPPATSEGCAFCGHDAEAHHPTCCELVWSPAHNDFVSCPCVRFEAAPEAHGARRG